MNIETKQEIKRGDIFFADLNPVVGHEQGGKRPVLVIQNNIGNRHSPTTIIAPITSAAKKALPTHMPLMNIDGVMEDSVLMLEQIRTIDKSRLVAYVCTLPDMSMNNVDSIIDVSLGVGNISMVKGNAFELALCSRCASDFYNSNAFIIKRLDYMQTDGGRCCYCRCRNGYDYLVERKGNVRGGENGKTESNTRT